MANFSWTDDQRAKLVLGATVEVHWDDVGLLRETVIGLDNVRIGWRLRLKDGESSIYTTLRLADPDSVVAP